MILNPNCSEIVASINARNNKELIEVLKDMMKALNAKLYITAPEYGDIAVKKEKQEGVTVLRLFSKYNDEGNMDEKNSKLIQEEKLKTYSFKLEVPLEYIYWKDYKIKIDEKIYELVFKQVMLTDTKTKEKTFIENFKIDVSRLYFGYISIGELGLRYGGAEDIGAFKDGSLYIQEDEYDASNFPAFKKILQSLVKKYKVSINGYDGGSTKSFDQWSKFNFINFLIDRKRFSQCGSYVDGKVYICDCENLEEFKSFLKKLKKAGVVLVDYLKKDKNSKLKYINPNDIQDILLSDDAKAIINGKEVPLKDLSLVPIDLNVSKVEQDQDLMYNLAYYAQISMNPKENKKIFYIFMNDETVVEDKAFTALIQYLENNSKEIFETK